MKNKKLVRSKFRKDVFKRDNYKCVCCNKKGVDRQENSDFPVKLDAHHITNRNEFKNGGYNIANGITLCSDCHLLAESIVFGFYPEDLYVKIGSSLKLAIELDEKGY